MWKELSLEEAKKLNTYGFKGWLILFYVISCLSIIQGIAGLSMLEEVSSAFGHRSANINIYYTMIIANIIGYIPFIILAPIKSRKMPKYTTYALIIAIIINLALGIPLTKKGLTMELIINTITIALFIVYLHKSKRVNITYLHRKRSF